LDFCEGNPHFWWLKSFSDALDKATFDTMGDGSDTGAAMLGWWERTLKAIHMAMVRHGKSGK